jgi:hypothetical protein
VFRDSLRVRAAAGDQRSIKNDSVQFGKITAPLSSTYFTSSMKRFAEEQNREGDPRCRHEDQRHGQDRFGIQDTDACRR